MKKFMRLLGAMAMLVSIVVVTVAPVQAAPIKEASAFGRTFGEWSGSWWNHALSNFDVFFDETGEFCDQGQLVAGNNTVWYLGFSFGQTFERDCTIPAGVSLFYPLVNTVAFNFVDDPAPFTLEEKIDIAVGAIESACTLRSTLDGESITIANTVVATQAQFLLSVPDFFGDVVDDEEAISGGYWVMLPPLSAGEHVLKIEGGGCAVEDPGDDLDLLRRGFFVDVTYNLFVE